MRKADLAERLAHGESKWKNRVQWARQTLVVKKEIDNAERGIWTITEAGRARASAAMRGAEPKAVTIPNLESIWDTYESAFKEQTLDRLLQLSPEQFEHFGKEFLRSYGFIDLEVTQLSGDGGLDGHGRLKVGVATMRVAFQCKRWRPESPVGRPDVDKFRGAIQGEFEQGIFFTTSDFSDPAKDASIKKGAVPVILINGEELVNIMIEKGIGVAKRPLFLFEEIQIPGVLEESDR